MPIKAIQDMPDVIDDGSSDDKNSNLLWKVIPALIVLVTGGLVIFALSHRQNDSGLFAETNVTDLVKKSLSSISQEAEQSTLDPANGEVALSERELRDAVRSSGCLAYWAGPADNVKYTLTCLNDGIAYVRYLPDGVRINDTRTEMRAVGTYAQRNAFKINQATGKSEGNIGFINADGNAVFYTKARPTNVYFGIRGKDLQVEIFDPDVDQALSLVLIKGRISQIT